MDHVQQRSKPRCQVAAIGVIEIEAREWLAVVFQQRHEQAAVDQRAKAVLHAESDAGAGAGEPDHQPHVVGGELGLDRDAEIPAILREFPTVGRDGRGRTPADAPVMAKIARMMRRVAVLQIGGRADCKLPLRTGHRNRDHVLRNHFAKTHACVIAFGNDIELFVRYSDIDPHIGIGIGKRRQ